MKVNWSWQRTLVVAAIGAFFFGGTDFLAEALVGDSGQLAVFVVRTLIFMPIFLIIVEVSERRRRRRSGLRE
jgi:hypothetical protein